jgi:hypothetical protein
MPYEQTAACRRLRQQNVQTKIGWFGMKGSGIVQRVISYSYDSERNIMILHVPDIQGG